MRLSHFFLISVLSITLLNGCAAIIIGTGVTAASVAGDRRSAGTIVEDKSILLQSLEFRGQDKEISQYSDIEINVYNMTVLLTGVAESPAITQKLAEKIKTIPRVRHVYDEVQIGAQSSLGADTSDVLTTSKVKFALYEVKVKDFSPSQVSYTTSQGTVYLMGLVTEEEANAVTEAVRYVNGVKRVVKLFEYVDTNNAS